MSIKMRYNKDRDAVCCECGDHKNDVLDMFDICIGGEIFTICDVCNLDLFYKTLKAECNKNARVKTQHDMAVLRKRGEKSYRARFLLRQEQEKAKRNEK